MGEKHLFTKTHLKKLTNTKTLTKTQFRGEESIKDYESELELTWYGSMDKFGKDEDFIIEHIVFIGTKIEGYVSQGGSLLQMKGEFVSQGKAIEEGAESSSEKCLHFKLEGVNTDTKIKYEMRDCPICIIN